MSIVDHGRSTQPNRFSEPRLRGEQEAIRRRSSAGTRVGLVAQLVPGVLGRAATAPLAAGHRWPEVPFLRLDHLTCQAPRAFTDRGQPADLPLGRPLLAQQLKDL
jgi:hypothetical protein